MIRSRAAPLAKVIRQFWIFEFDGAYRSNVKMSLFRNRYYMNIQDSLKQDNHGIDP